MFTHVIRKYIQVLLAAVCTLLRHVITCYNRVDNSSQTILWRETLSTSDSVTADSIDLVCNGYTSSQAVITPQREDNASQCLSMALSDSLTPVLIHLLYSTVQIRFLPQQNLLPFSKKRNCRRMHLPTNSMTRCHRQLLLQIQRLPRVRLQSHLLLSKPQTLHRDSISLSKRCIPVKHIAPSINLHQGCSSRASTLC